MADGMYSLFFEKTVLLFLFVFFPAYIIKSVILIFYLKNKSKKFMLIDVLKLMLISPFIVFVFSFFVFHQYIFASINFMHVLLLLVAYAIGIWVDLKIVKNTLGKSEKKYKKMMVFYGVCFLISAIVCFLIYVLNL